MNANARLITAIFTKPLASPRGPGGGQGPPPSRPRNKQTPRRASAPKPRAKNDREGQRSAEERGGTSRRAWTRACFGLPARGLEAFGGCKRGRASWRGAPPRPLPETLISSFGKKGENTGGLLGLKVMCASPTFCEKSDVFHHHDIKITVFNGAFTSAPVLIAASLPQLHKLYCSTIIIAN